MQEWFINAVRFLKLFDCDRNFKADIIILLVINVINDFAYLCLISI